MARWGARLTALLCVAGCGLLPRSGDNLVDELQTYAYLLLNVLGVLDPMRLETVDWRIPGPHRPANGTIEEFHTWEPPDPESHSDVKVFRGAARPENGFNLECFTRGGDPLKVFEEALEGEKMMVFRDVTNRSSAESMAFDEYVRLLRAAQADSAQKMPYLRALHRPMSQCGGAIPWRQWREKYFSRFSTPVFSHPNPLFFFGTNGTYSAMHTDVTDSYFVQIYGRKKWVFVEPQYTPQVKPHAQYSNVAYDAGIAPFHEAIPESIVMREVVLEPGDILYFPPMTWHAVLNLDSVTLGADLPVPDPIKAFKRNWFLTAATVLNPFTTIRVASGVLGSDSSVSSHDALLNVFFRGYTAGANIGPSFWWSAFVACCVIAVGRWMLNPKSRWQGGCTGVGSTARC